MKTTIRKFNGKKYVWDTWAFFRVEAEQEKKRLQKMGFLVRIVKDAKGYLIYRSDKKARRNK